MSSGLVLNTNINSLVAQNALTSSGTQLSQALEQLSTGLRINTAADDAAGYAIVNGMTSQINGLNQASQNANDGVSLSQTASGALSEIVNDLQSMRDLAVESLNATNSSADRDDLDAQFQQLKADIDNVASTTQFNGVNLLDGSFQGATFQVGANAGQTITMTSVASAASNNLGQLYTAAATDPAAYTSTGATGGTAVANGDSGTFTLTIGGKQYTTSAVTLTGTQSTDLTTIAAAITQATGDVGVVASVDANGKGINLSSTTQQTVTASYTASTGAETLATFGLNASNDLAPTNTYAATGGTVTDSLSAGTTTYAVNGGAVTDGLSAGTTTYAATGTTSGDTFTANDAGTFTVSIGGTDYTTATVAAGSLDGTAADDVTAIKNALNNVTSFTAAGYTASVSGNNLVITGGATAFTVDSATFNETGSGTGTIDLGLTNTAATGTTTGASSGTVSVVIGGNTYTTAAINGFDGTAADDVTAIKDALNNVTSFTAAGYTASESGGKLVITGGSTPFTVTSASYTGTGTIDLGIANNTAATGTTTGASTGTVAVVIGGNTYTTATISGLDGTAANDVAKVAAALNAVTSFSGAGYSASVNADNQLVITGGASAFTVTSAAYTAVTGTGALDLGLANQAAAENNAGASTSTLADANVKTVDSSNEVLIQIDAALQQLATTGADLGAYQDRFQAAVTGLETDATNLSSAKSGIQDTDYAQATSQLTQAQILQQAGTAMVAQANTIPQNVLTLINKLA